MHLPWRKTQTLAFWSLDDVSKVFQHSNSSQSTYRRSSAISLPPPDGSHLWAVRWCRWCTASRPAGSPPSCPAPAPRRPPEAAAAARPPPPAAAVRCRPPPAPGAAPSPVWSAPPPTQSPPGSSGAARPGGRGIGARLPGGGRCHGAARTADCPDSSVTARTVTDSPDSPDFDEEVETDVANTE